MGNYFIAIRVINFTIVIFNLISYIMYSFCYLYVLLLFLTFVCLCIVSIIVTDDQQGGPI